jgi:5-methylcytosine-specific restriction endonuclease McrA
MPYQRNGKRNYDAELQWEKTSKPNRVKDRAERNKARAMLMEEGLVKKGDGMHVDHKHPLSKGGTTKRSNLRAVKASTNLALKRKRDGSLK